MNKVCFVYCISALLVCSWVDSKSQEKPEQTYIWNGSGFDRAPTYTEVIGSIFLFDDWHNGVIKLENGKNYNNVQLKYDQLNDQLNFKLEEGKPMTFTVPIKAFDIIVFDLEGNKTVQSFVNGFPAIDGGTDKSYYQVFNPGASPKIEFVKRLKKVIYERKVYSSAVAEKLVEDRTYYYLVMNKRLFRIKRSPKELLKYMGDYKKEINEFIAKNKLNFKSDNDFAEVVKYYNSLS
ncbi:hypothetical protein OQX61_17200 [Pedobacter sp. PLR]|uniref:hypothetical protein n=1 Tax=Pedobacter sp. PLR TaxID=2994465 RepID=UPI0022454BD3|nr:hypothetical protein [Pedobacter sp. PLR]MCX2453017.1 hypothetical protein [Pedobacter sp. PLR]